MATWKSIITLDEQEILKHVKDDFSASQQARQRINEFNLMCLKTFYALDLDMPLDDPVASYDNRVPGMARNMFSFARSNSFYPPIARAIILAYLAQLITGTFPSDEGWLQGIANDEMDVKAVEKFVQAAEFMYREIDYRSEVEMAYLQALVMDVSLIYTGWKIEPDVVPTPRNKTLRIFGFDTHIPTMQEAVTFRYEKDAKSQPNFFTPNTFNLRVDPLATHGDLEQSDPLFIGLTMRMNKAKLHRLAESRMLSEAEWAGNHLKVKGHKEAKPEEEARGGKEGDTGTTDYESILADQLRVKGEGQAATNEDVNHYRVDLYWQKFAHVIVLNNTYIVHKEQMMGWPFQILRSYPIHGRFSGRSVMADLIGIQHDITAMCRARRDRQADDAYPKRIVNIDYFASDDEARLAVEGDTPIIYVEGNKAADQKLPPITLLEHTHPYDSTFQEMTWEINWAHRVAGIDDTSEGVFAAGGARTATESQERSAGGKVRREYMLSRLRREAIAKATYKLWMLEQMYSSREIRLRIAGPMGAVSFVKYSSKDFVFHTPPEFKIITKGQINDMMTDAQIFMNALGMALTNPIAAQYVKMSPSLFELYRKMGIENPERLLQTDKPADFLIPVEMEIQSLIYNMDVPLSQLHDPQERFDAISKFIVSERFSTLDEQAQTRIAARGDEYAALLAQKGGGAPGVPLGGPGTSMQGGMMTGGQNVGQNAGGSANPASNPALGTINRMGAGPIAPGA